MALTQDLAQQLETAYKAGDTAAVNQMLQGNKVTAGDVQGYFNLAPTQMQQLGGLSFYSAPATTTVAAPATAVTTTGGLPVVNQTATSASTTSAPVKLSIPSVVYASSPEGHANYYNSLLAQGFTDAQIRAAAGSITDQDWADLQNRATALRQSPQNAVVTTGQNQAASAVDLNTARNLILGSYAGIGRTGFGTDIANVDQPGYNYWLGELQSGRIKPEDFRSVFSNAVNQFIADNPQNAYSQQALSTMVGNVLNPANNLTEAQQASAILGLQNKFGLTDADFSRLSGGRYTADQFSSYLNPIRDFQTNYELVMNNPTSTASEVVDFVNNALNTSQISNLYGTRLNELKNSNEFKEIERLATVGTVRDYEGNEYNPLTLKKLVGQIGQNFDTSRMSGGAFATSGESIGFDYGEAAKVFGSNPNAAQQIVLDMARSLIKSGITDISQLGTAERYQTGANQVAVDDEGYLLREDFISGSMVRDRKLSDDELAQVRMIESIGTGEGGGDVYRSRVFDDPIYGYRQSMSGIDLPSDFDEQMAQRFNEAGFRFGETATGKGRTRYNVVYDPETGQPKFTTEAKMSGWYDAAPILAMVATMFGVPALSNLISGALPGAAVTGGAGAAGAASGIGFVPATAANTAISNALASGLIQGGISELTGGDFGKGFVRGGLPGIVNYGLGNIIPADFAAANPRAAAALQSIGSNVLTAGLTGESMTDALRSGLTGTAISTVTNAVLNRIPGYSDLPAAGKALVNQGLNAAIRGGRTDPLAVVMSLISAAKGAQGGARKAKGGLAMARGGAVPGYYDGGDVDLRARSNLDIGDFNFDFGNFDASDFDFGGLDLGDLDLGSLDMGNLDFGSNFDLGSFNDIAAADLIGSDVSVPRVDDLLLASAGNDSGGFRVEVGGTPTFADSPDASRVPLNFGERLLSSEEFVTDTMPRGSFYDPMRNAWITSSQELTDISDIASQGFGYGTAFAPGTGDFARLDRDLYNTQLADQNVIDSILGSDSRFFGAYGDNAPSDADIQNALLEGFTGDLGRVEVTASREPDEDFYEAGSGVLDESGDFYEAGSGVLDENDLGRVEVVGRREEDDEVTDDEVTDDEDTEDEECAEGFHRGPTGVCVPDDDETDDDTTCPPGYVYNLNTRQCEKVGTPPPPRPPTRPPAPAPLAVTSIGGTNINIPGVQQLAPLVLQALRTEGGGGRFMDPLERLKEAVAGTRGSAAEMFKMDPYLEGVLRQRADPGYYSYGQEPSLDEIVNRRPFAQGGAVAGYAGGGLASPLMAAMGGTSLVEGREDFREGKHVAGPGDGQSDDIPAMLADGEFVFPADVVAALGNGSTKAGTDKLYEMMHSIRKYHRSAKPQDLPPPAKKSPLDYLSKGKKGAKA